MFVILHTELLSFRVWTFVRGWGTMCFLSFVTVYVFRFIFVGSCFSFFRFMFLVLYLDLRLCQWFSKILTKPVSKHSIIAWVCVHVRLDESKFHESNTANCSDWNKSWNLVFCVNVRQNSVSITESLFLSISLSLILFSVLWLVQTCRGISWLC